MERELRSEFSFLERKGRLFYRSPLSEVLAGLYFDVSQAGAACFYVHFFALPLYVPQRVLSLSFGERLLREEGGRSGSSPHSGSIANESIWSLDEEPQRIQLVEVIEKRGLTMMNRFQTAEDIASHLVEISGDANGLYHIEAVAYSRALIGQSRLASNALERLLKKADPGIRWQERMSERAQRLLICLSRSDEKAVKELLREWRSESLANLGLRDAEDKGPTRKHLSGV